MKVIVLTGAGISAESGIKTFRDADGLWEGHDVKEVATPEGWQSNPELVQDFYNQRRAQLSEVKPNQAHYSITKLQESFKTVVITQNVDNLHEEAGNNNVIHLHGELTKVRCVSCHTVQEWKGNLSLNDKCSCGYQLRPHIVWFGEAVPKLEVAIKECLDSNVAIIVGTSMQVYPAASLISYVPKDCSIYYVDPKPSINYELGILADRLSIFNENATTGLEKVVNILLNN